MAGLRKIKKFLSQDNWCAGRDSNRAYLEQYVLPLRHPYKFTPVHSSLILILFVFSFIQLHSHFLFNIFSLFLPIKFSNFPCILIRSLPQFLLLCLLICNSSVILPLPFKFIIHLSSYRSMLYILATDSVGTVILIELHIPLLFSVYSPIFFFPQQFHLSFLHFLLLTFSSSFLTSSLICPIS